MKKMLALCLVALLALCCLVSASAEEPKMTDGYYFYLIPDMGISSFVHFNEDGTYYASYLGGASLDAGTYEVVDQTVEYFEDLDGDGVADSEGGQTLTADKAVILRSFLSTGEQVIAFADDTLMDMDLAGMAHHRNLAHKADYAYNPVVDETPITIAEFYAHGSTGDAIFFGHDGSFTDGTGDMLRFGTWTVADPDTYDLLFDDETTGTFAFNADHTAATMTVGDEVTELVADVNAAALGAPLYFLNGSLEIENPEYGTIPYDLAGEMYADNTVKLQIVAYGNAIDLDQGTWALADNGYTINFVFDNAGEIASALNMETYAVTVHYVYNGSANGDIDCELLLTGNEEAAAAEPAVQFTLAGEFAVEHPDYGTLTYEVKGNMYDDGTVQMTIGAYGNDSDLDQGTWGLEENGYTVKFVFEKAGEILSDLNFETQEVTVHYVLAGTEQAGDVDAVLALK